MYDLIIRDGTIVDGTGADARRGDVAVKDGKVVAVGDAIEGGMQNSGLALGIIAVTFNADLGMVIIASLWGIWHIVSGLTLAVAWRMKDARLAH